MTNLTMILFGYEQAQLIETRTFDGQYWYVASDVCTLIGIVNHSAVVHRKSKGGTALNDHEWRRKTISVDGKRKSVLLVNNGGLGKLIFRIDTPIARRARENFYSYVPFEAWYKYTRGEITSLGI